MSATKTRPAPTLSLLDRAWAAVPDLASTQASLALVTERLREVMATVPVADDDAWTAGLVERLDDGEGLPDDLGADYLSIVQQRQTHAAARGALQRVAEQLADRRRRLRGTGADDALGVLRSELEDVLEEAGPVLDRLGPVRDAEDALAAGASAADDLRAARDLLARYEALRTAQGQILTWALEPPDSASRDVVVTPRVIREQVATVGSVRNYRELQPTGEDQHQLVTRKGVDGTGRRFSETSAVARPGPADRPAVWPTGDALDDLRYLTGPDAQPWVPSVAEMQAAQQPTEQAEQTGPPARSLQVSEARARQLSAKLPAMQEPRYSGSGMNGGQEW